MEALCGLEASLATSCCTHKTTSAKELPSLSTLKRYGGRSFDPSSFAFFWSFLNPFYLLESKSSSRRSALWPSWTLSKSSNGSGFECKYSMSSYARLFTGLGFCFLMSLSCRMRSQVCGKQPENANLASLEKYIITMSSMLLKPEATEMTEICGSCVDS